uniref:Protein kinase domain-containing protein n=1 Tax=viral metagenome TaxID=1070528 RepID=A0A6C0IXZ6_9ZZZZ
MGKIINVYNSDLMGKRVYQKGRGRLQSINEDYSGSDKRRERLVKNITLVFDNGTQLQVVIKIAPFFEDQLNNYTENEDLGEIVLSNDYEHESKIYNFFNEKVNDKIVDKYVLKSYTGGISKNGDFKLNGETFNFINLKMSKDLEELEQPPRTIIGYVYIITEPMINIKTFYDTKPKDETKLKKFITTTFNTLSHLYNTYEFCHWDFHAQNTKFNELTGEILIFDFDLSTTKKYNNSDYINRIPLIRPIILDYCEMMGQSIATSYQENKSQLAHNWDLFMFVSGLKKKYSLDYLKNLPIILNDIKFVNLLEIYEKGVNLVEEIRDVVRFIKLPKIFNSLKFDIYPKMDSISKQLLITSLEEQLHTHIINIIENKYKPSLNTTELTYFNDNIDYIYKFINLYIDSFVQTYVDIYINYGEVVKIELSHYDYIFFASYYMFIEGNYFIK